MSVVTLCIYSMKSSFYNEYITPTTCADSDAECIKSCTVHDHGNVDSDTPNGVCDMKRKTCTCVDGHVLNTTYGAVAYNVCNKIDTCNLACLKNFPLIPNVLGRCVRGKYDVVDKCFCYYIT